MKVKLFFLFLLFSACSYAQTAWTQKANVGGLVRVGAVGFSIGNNGYIGTGDDNFFPYSDFWQWDKSTNVWTQKASFAGGPRGYAVGFSIGAKGYIGTGYDNSNFNFTFFNDLWEWDQATNIWSQKSSFPGTARLQATGFSIGTKGYIGTGQDGSSNFFKDFWEWDQTTNTWSQKANLPGVARNYAAGFAIGTKGYIGLGYDAGAGELQDIWECDQATNTWTQKANFGGGLWDAAACFSIGAKGHVGTGGVDTIKGTKEFWEWDQATNIWTRKTDFGGLGRFGAVGFAIGSKGYIGTGADGGLSCKNDFWEYDPSADCIVSNFTTPSYTVNIGSTVTFTNASTSATSYVWLNNGTMFSTNTNTLYTYNTLGTYTVSLIASNATCTDTCVKKITVACMVNSAFNTNSYFVIQGDTVSYSSNNKNGSGYSWLCNGVPFSTLDSGSYGFNTPGNYTVSLTVNMGPCSSTTQTVVVVHTCDTWHQKNSFSATGSPRVNLFTIGRKAYVGFGANSSYVYLNDLWEWNQANGPFGYWTQKANFPGNLRSPGFSFSVAGKGYVGGGFQGWSANPPFLKDFWVWDQATNVWTQKTDFPGTERTAFSFVIGGKAYVGGGSGPPIVTGNPTYFYDLWEWDPVADTWAQKANFPGPGRNGPVSFTIGTKGYIATGYGASDYDDLWEWDQTINTWAQKASFPGGTRYSAAGFAIGTKGYLGTGYKVGLGDPFKDFWEWDQPTNTWVQKADFSAQKRLDAVGFSIGDRGYLGLGSDGTGTYYKDLWEYKPCGPVTNASQSELLNLQTYSAIYPNPSSGLFTIQSPEKISQIEILNVLGEKVYSASNNLHLTTCKIDMGKQPKGVYFYKALLADGLICTGKLIIE